MMIHSGTKKVPHDEWIREQALLGPYIPYPIKPLQAAYTVRKDNTICWKSNFYSLPLGTYKGRGSTVMVRVENGQLWISDPLCVELCRHSISIVKGARIKNSDHCRDKSSAVQQMMAELSQKFNPTWL